MTLQTAAVTHQLRRGINLNTINRPLNAHNNKMYLDSASVPNLRCNLKWESTTSRDDLDTSLSLLPAVT